MNSSRRILASVLLLLFAACLPAVAASAQEDGSPGADEMAIRSVLDTWIAASEAKDIDAFASVYAPDAVLMLEGAPDMRGREAIRAGMGGLMANDPHFSLSFEADEIVVAKSADLAYETGTYELSMSDAEGNAAPQQGHYVVVWRKQEDGTWKVAVDAPISDPPQAPSD